ncbi:MAG: GFA family protein [Gammaproteobacteria bacterium]|nr:GFA family protein [Gammaproteobacteria bacterium]
MDPAIGKSGGCQCGTIRYQLRGSPKMLYTCHCSDCQKQSSSAFGMSLIMDRADVEFTRGGEQLKIWDTRGEDGRLKRCAFCAECGTRIYHASEPEDETISIKAGSLDDTHWLRPVAHIWLQSAQPWLEIDATDRLCFVREPTDRAALAEAWQQQSTAGK